MFEREPRPIYHMKFAKLASEASTCLRRHYGAAIFKDNVLLSTGYNGSPRNYINCCEGDKCERREKGVSILERFELCRAVHAEVNAIVTAGYERVKGSNLFLYGYDLDSNCEIELPTPCNLCANIIANFGIERVYSYYHGEIRIL